MCLNASSIQTSRQRNDVRPAGFHLIMVIAFSFPVTTDALYVRNFVPRIHWNQKIGKYCCALEYTLFYKIVLGKSARHFLKIFVIRFLKNILNTKSGLKWSIASSLKFTT